MRFDPRYSAVLTLYLILDAALRDFAGGPDQEFLLALSFTAVLALAIPIALIICVRLLFKRKLTTALSILLSPIIAGLAAYLAMKPLYVVLPYAKKAQISYNFDAKNTSYKEWLVSCTDDWAANSFMSRRSYIYDASDNTRSDENARDLGGHFYLYYTEHRNCEGAL